MSKVKQFASEIDAWIARERGGFSERYEGGQRLVYRVGLPEDSGLKIWAYESPEQHERYVREVSALADLAHPGLPRVVAYMTDVVISGERFSMYQEQWLEAPALRTQSLPLDETASATLLRSAAEVLEAVHDARIVHRDVSLGNVLWDGAQAYVVDFGLAKHLDLDQITGTQEDLGGTNLCKSPEQHQGVSADLRAPTDVFSLGIVGFCAATGDHPFLCTGERLDRQSYLRRIYHRDVQHAAPAVVEEVLGRMLHPDPFARPTMSAIAAELR